MSPSNLAARIGLAALLLGFLTTEANAQRGGGRLSARWHGQDGHDSVGYSPERKPNQYQDMHFVLHGLPASEIKAIEIKGHGGGQWNYPASGNQWLADVVPAKGAAKVDVYVEAYQPENGREFQIQVVLNDGRKTELIVKGGKADPNLRMPGTGIDAKWIGRGPVDLTSPSCAPGPDGVPDVRVALTRIPKDVALKSLEILGPKGYAWHHGPNPKGYHNAEWIPAKDDPTRGELVFSAGEEIKGHNLRIIAQYNNDKGDSTTVAVGPMGGVVRAAKALVPALSVSKTIKGTWLGQTGEVATPGDVRIGLEGLAGLDIAAAALSDSAVACYVYKSNDRIKFDTEPYPQPLKLKRIDRDRAELSFFPARDESGNILTLRLQTREGKNVLVDVPGGPADLALRSPAPSSAAIEAKPGDDLNSLAARGGTIRLAAGTYTLKSPLNLPAPTTLVGTTGTILSFEPEGGAPWTTAIKIHAGRTTLESLAIRFPKPIAWNQQVSYGPAIIGTTDNLDPQPQSQDPRAGLVFKGLDIEGPPAASNRERSPNAFRLVTANSGRIEKCKIRAGSIETDGGPWTIVGNEFAGPPSNALCLDLIAAHHPHDCVIKDNQVRLAPNAGKVYRFLVFTQRGTRNLVANNSIHGIGASEKDAVQHENTPEVILTESYRLHFEGRPHGVSFEGRLVSIPNPQGEPASAGSALTVLTGPEAGQWRTIVHAFGPNHYLLDAPIRSEVESVSIATGFVRDTFESNTVSNRDSRICDNLVLAGNQFGVTVRKNHLIGGGHSFRFLSTPSEKPGPWGWSHNPFVGGTIEGNVFEDAWKGGQMGVEHNFTARSNRARVYLTASFKDNTFTWTPDFVSTRTKDDPKTPLIGAQFGFVPALDPAEMTITESGTRAEGSRPRTVVWVYGATLNNRLLRGAALPLSSTTATSPRNDRQLGSSASSPRAR